MPRPRSLTTADLGSAALAVIDRDGLPALTMRSLAKQLRMATMGLYRYVSDRNQLEVLIVDQVLDTLDVSVPSAADWREQVTILLDRMRAAAAAHPATVPLLLQYRQSSMNSIRWIEAMLSVLTAAGFEGRERVVAQRTIVGFLFGVLQSQHYASIAGAGTAAMAKLPAADFPLLAQTAAQASAMSVDEEFREGVRIVLRGLTP